MVRAKYREQCTEAIKINAVRCSSRTGSNDHFIVATALESRSALEKDVRQPSQDDSIAIP